MNGIRPPERQTPRAAGFESSSLGGLAGHSSTEILLARLDGVQKSGNGWRARCPACGGTSRKVSITDGHDGKTLLHCFGGCDPLTIVQSVGLTLAALYPERLAPSTPQEMRVARRAALHTNWDAALGVLTREATVVLIAARMVARWQVLSIEDDARLALATQRIDTARQVLHRR